MIACVRTYQLIFKAWDKGVRTEGQRILCSFSTIKGNVIYKAFKVNCYNITVLCSTVFYCNCSGVFLLLFFQFCFYFFVCYFNFCLRNLYAFVFAQGYFRFYSYFCGKDKGFTWL
ncbi:membrane protein [gut metagenome]|uniref:Membrane protein n=1 Tax=gut metagenome TaxID=749906 RepID=J9G198_9ZZZZ